MEIKQKTTAVPEDKGKTTEEAPEVLEEIVVEELSIDGICGVY